MSDTTKNKIKKGSLKLVIKRRVEEVVPKDIQINYNYDYEIPASFVHRSIKIKFKPKKKELKKIETYPTTVRPIIVPMAQVIYERPPEKKIVKEVVEDEGIEIPEV